MGSLMEMLKDKILLFFPRCFAMNTVSKLSNDVNKLPPEKTIQCLSQEKLGPAPSLAIVAWLL